ncbi:lactonase family protein [Bythopirellula polymerisocia]|uniref:6-phosphogluconolactonase n=1 Tax=Bythopirellula polymerisocia TaxID=2528003 RepID=A0A5C6CMS1_9BACT|nr:lactonase family protein [Bythopirellula polymerisocia]TWU24641.1 6-phosphogluconolactonase [Bythopirellula polymerisocia]
MPSLAACLLFFAVSQSALGENVAVWIGMGSPQNGETAGIYRAMLDQETGKLEPPQLAVEVAEPEFLAIRSDGKCLYAACRLPGGEAGIAAFEITADDKSLRHFNSQSLGGGAACHVALDPTSRCLFSAQYGDGTIATFPLAEAGSIEPRAALIKHTGAGPDKARQESPHPHSVNPAAKNNFLLVPDLGTDEIVIYRTDPETGSVEKHGHGNSPPGGGPRHMTFSPNGKFAYVANEMGLSVTVFKYDSQAGALESIQTIPTLPKELRIPASNCSEIRMHPSGRFLYVANRVHDSITVFSVDPEGGKLSFIEAIPAHGEHPRNFNLDPTGKWLLAAGRDSNSISVFKIDQDNGRLEYTGQTVNSPSPICILFQPQTY